MERSARGQGRARPFATRRRAKWSVSLRHPPYRLHVAVGPEPAGVKVEFGPTLSASVSPALFKNGRNRTKWRTKVMVVVVTEFEKAKVLKVCVVGQYCKSFGESSSDCGS